LSTEKQARRDETRDRVWYETQALVTEIPDCEVRTFMSGDDALCVQIKIARRFERLSIPMSDIAQTPEEHVGFQILMFLRHAKIVKEYRHKRDSKPELP